MGKKTKPTTLESYLLHKHQTTSVRDAAANLRSAQEESLPGIRASPHSCAPARSSTSSRDRSASLQTPTCFEPTASASRTAAEKNPFPPPLRLPHTPGCSLPSPSPSPPPADRPPAPEDEPTPRSPSPHTSSSSSGHRPLPAALPRLHGGNRPRPEGGRPRGSPGPPLRVRKATGEMRPEVRAGPGEGAGRRAPQGEPAGRLHNPATAGARRQVGGAGLQQGGSAGEGDPHSGGGPSLTCCGSLVLRLRARLPLWSSSSPPPSPEDRAADSSASAPHLSPARAAEAKVEDKAGGVRGRRNPISEPLRPNERAGATNKHVRSELSPPPPSSGRAPHLPPLRARFRLPGWAAGARGYGVPCFVWGRVSRGGGGSRVSPGTQGAVGTRKRFLASLLVRGKVSLPQGVDPLALR